MMLGEEAISMHLNHIMYIYNYTIYYVNGELQKEWQYSYAPIVADYSVDRSLFYLTWA